ncbi:MAG: formylmethanofuran dehydrogenase subunit C, partial [Methermicoccaceae archaeon]
MEMKGGTLHILGDAADHVGCAYRGSWHGMSGGRIVIEGSAKSQLGGGMSGGEIVVNGSVENFCAIRQNGGLIVVKGDAVRGVGAEMTAGTTVVAGHILQFLPGFEYVGTENELKLESTELSGEFLKFAGDYAVSARAKGTLYVASDMNRGL